MEMVFGNDGWLMVSVMAVRCWDHGGGEEGGGDNTGNGNGAERRT